MNYKTMIFAALLMPLVSVSNADDINAQIQTLIELRDEKENELFKLDKKIDEKRIYVRSIFNEYVKIVGELIIEQAKTSDINDKKFKKCKEEIREIILDFSKKIDEAVDSDTFQQFFYENIKLRSIGYKNDCEVIKFYIVRAVFENFALVSLIEKYVSRAQSLLDLDRKINDLQNKLTLY